MFGIQKEPIFGTYGEFTIGSEGERVFAQFLLTKMKPGTDGSWENNLASQMVPWREVFNIEELTFDELLQRDLDDSRVAHELIPYLLGKSGAVARFFPPILAVLVPKRMDKTGIMPYYPAPQNLSETSVNFGGLFDFEKTSLEGELTPLGVLKYNRQKTAFIIVDGQHRAMAILALHRQINEQWRGNNYATFYHHLELTEEEIKNIELPVCIVFFPELHEDNLSLQKRGVDLKSVCREIFLAVNKNAKPVSQSRELLLDDEDLAARMMRETLSKLKNRSENNASLARIYSFAFADGVGDKQYRKSEVVVGQLEFTSAVALHKMHAAISFGVPAAFQLEETQDITDGRRIQNPDRPGKILKGTSLNRWSSLSRKSGKFHDPQDVETAVSLLANMTDEVILPLFDRFRPFAVHNFEIRALKNRLEDPTLKADPIQRKCYSLLFEGSGVKSIFDSHIDRLEERKKNAQEDGEAVGDYILNQLKDAKAIESAWQKRRDEIRNRRAARLFNLDYQKFFEVEGNEAEREEIIDQAKSIFDTVSTQAFQLGYLMAVHGVVELMLPADSPYDHRLKCVRFVSDLFVSSLNAYFGGDSTVEHRTLTGFIKESRANVFDPKKLGLRGLLAQSVKQLSEKQWVFFRYAVLEMIHCKYGYKTILKQLDGADDLSLAEAYRHSLPHLLGSILKLRQSYIKEAQETALNSADFKQDLQMKKVEMKALGKSEIEMEEALKQAEDETSQEVYDQCKANIEASLGELASVNKLLDRLMVQESQEGDHEI